jgi:hypothetical protein
MLTRSLRRIGLMNPVLAGRSGYLWSAQSERFEEREERVRRSIAARLGIKGHVLGECFLFERQVGVQVDLSRLDPLMA